MAGAGSRLIEKDNGWNDFVRRTKQAMSEQGVVKIGILAGAPTRRTAAEEMDFKVEKQIAKWEDRKPAAPAAGTSTLSNVALGSIHEFGAPSAGIPERSFLRATMDANWERYQWMLRRLAQSVVKGKATVAEGLNLIGAKIASDVRKRIASGISPPLKDATKRRKGSSKPLVDTGQLRASISHAYVKGGP